HPARVAPRVRRDQPAHRHGRRGGALRARHLGGDPRNDQVNLALNTLASRALLWHRGASTFLTELESREFPAVTPEPLFPRLGRVRLGGGHAAQHTGRTCGTAVLALANALFDPDLRAHLRSEEHTSELQSRFDLVCRL